MTRIAAKVWGVELKKPKSFKILSNSLVKSYNITHWNRLSPDISNPLEKMIAFEANRTNFTFTPKETVIPLDPPKTDS